MEDSLVVEIEIDERYAGLPRPPLSRVDRAFGAGRDSHRRQDGAMADLLEVHHWWW